MMLRFLKSLTALALAGVAVAGYALPADAQGDFLSDILLPESQERQLAEQEHPKILEQFGGEYDDPELSRYVQSLVDFLGATSARHDIQYRVTILNSPVVNAFALPAGYLYVTRGLLALADNEAELAGVLAHEIGHVTARHTAQRFSRTMLTQGLVGLLGAVTQGSQLEGLAGVVQPAAVVALQSFSREHEHEADLLGVETMSRAGFDPFAMATFLAKLEHKSKLDAQLKGQQANGGSQMDLFSTHPRTADRVRRSAEQAAGRLVRDPMAERELYLNKISGLLYGDDPEQGFVRGQVFAHPQLDIRFEVPQGYALLNGQNEVIAQGPEGSLIRFDRAPEVQTNNPVAYLRDGWAQGATLQDLRDLRVNGFPAGTGALRLDSQGQLIDLRLLAVQTAPRTMYRFLFAVPAANAQGLSAAFRQTADSFGRLSAAERRDLRPYRLITYRVRSGDTVDSLARRLPYSSFQDERFRVLNGLAPDDQLHSGQIVKLIAAN